MLKLQSAIRAWRGMALVLGLAALSGCVGISYQRPGDHIAPREGKTLLFGRLRFFHDEREFFPWEVKVAVFPEADTERHLWLLRLNGRAVSAEVHPDPDGSLAIWLQSGDYALLGTNQVVESGPAPFEVVALFRVPAGPVAAYAGELTMKIETHEGFYASNTEFGSRSVKVHPIDLARATLEQRLGTLPEPPVVSPWCVSDTLPGFNDRELATRAKALLDQCHAAP